MFVAGMIVVGVGVLLVLMGAYMGFVEWKSNLAKAAAEGLEGAAAETIGAFEKLMKILLAHPMGMRFIVLGMLMILIGAAMAGVDLMGG